MTKPYMRRCWIAEAPPGKWSSGPTVVWDFEDVERTLEKYREMGYGITGPFVLVEAVVERLCEVSVPHNQHRYDYARFVNEEWGADAHQGETSCSSTSE
jgi:hypothetical protein